MDNQFTNKKKNMIKNFKIFESKFFSAELLNTLRLKLNNNFSCFISKNEIKFEGNDYKKNQNYISINKNKNKICIGFTAYDFDPKIEFISDLIINKLIENNIIIEPYKSHIDNYWDYFSVTFDVKYYNDAIEIIRNLKESDIELYSIAGKFNI